MKQLKKFWVSLVLLFSVDASAISINLVSGHSSIAQGGALAVQVTISGLDDKAAPSLGVYDLDVYFDNSLFNFSQVLWGDSTKGNQLDLNGFGSVQASSSSSGVINLFELSLDDSLALNEWQAGEFTLFTLLFDAIALGSGTFSIVHPILGDADGNNLLVNHLGDTQVSVIAAAVPEPSSGLLLLGLLAVIMLRVRMAQSAK